MRTAGNECRLHARAEAVVDVDDRDAGGAAGEHAEERGEAAEGGAVADAGGDANDGSVREAAHDAWQCAFHAGNHHDRVGTVQRGALRQDAVQRGHPGVVDALHMRAQRVGGDRRFFGNRQVGRSGGDYGHVAVAFQVAHGRGRSASTPSRDTARLHQPGTVRPPPSLK